MLAKVIAIVSACFLLHAAYVLSSSKLEKPFAEFSMYCRNGGGTTTLTIDKALAYELSKDKKILTIYEKNQRTIFSFTAPGDTCVVGPVVFKTLET